MQNLPNCSWTVQIEASVHETMIRGWKLAGSSDRIRPAAGGSPWTQAARAHHTWIMHVWALDRSPPPSTLSALHAPVGSENALDVLFIFLG